MNSAYPLDATHVASAAEKMIEEYGVHAAQWASAILRAVSMSGVMINQVTLSWGGLPSKRHYLRPEDCQTGQVVET